MPLLTGGCLQEFRSLELVGGAPRRVGRQIFEGLVRHALVETLDDHGIASRSLELREADHHAKTNKEHQHEHCARCQSFERADDELLNFAGAHALSAPLLDFSGTLYMTSPRRTSSMARRSAFFGNGPSSDRMRRRAPRRSCFARRAATSTNRNRLSIGGTG